MPHSDRNQEPLPAPQGPWSTNGTYVWPTADREVINKIGHLIALEVPIDFHESGNGNWRTRDAAARVLAAGPELLDALSEAIVWWDDRKPDYEPDGTDPIAPWRAAVAKARE